MTVVDQSCQREGLHGGAVSKAVCQAIPETCGMVFEGIVPKRQEDPCVLSFISCVDGQPSGDAQSLHKSGHLGHESWRAT